ncbi:MAG: hypothetical protein JNM19_17235, partial [Chitinophagaceae bacterium]|nr:hypothetical protein [Chitinophagaceae bacterium]
MRMISKSLSTAALLLAVFQSKVATAQVPAAYPAGTPVSYVRTWDAAAPEQDGNVLMNRPLRDVKQATQYFDGLGRPIQTVMKQGSLETGGTTTDMVSASLYDQYGREIKKYLPFAANNEGGNSSISDGGFKLNPFQQQQSFMTAQYGAQGETVFYGQTNFEASPLNRAEKSMAPGNSWTGSGRGVEMKYWNNASVDNVQMWRCDNVSGGFGNYVSTGAYPAGELYKTATVDEHGKQVIEFKDKEGKVLLKKVQLTAAADDGTGRNYDGWMSTYYIYDDMDKLRCVIQPEGVKKMTVDGWALTTTMLNEQCFRYEYDNRGRMTMKKVPGAGEVYMVYDARDRLVMTQDANLRAQGKWMVTKYDALNRPEETGLWTNATAFATHLSSAYTSSSYPVTSSGYEELTKTFYESYSWLSSYGNPLPSTYNSSYNSYFQPVSNDTWPYPQANVQTSNLKGMPTGSRVKVPGTGIYLYTVSIYDEKGRVIQVQSTNYSGGTDIATTQYSWAGQPLVMVTKHEKQGTNAQTTITVTQLSYDDLGRLAKTEKKVSNTNVNSGAMPGYKTIAANEYDKLGQLKKKKLAPDHNSGAGLETLEYDYNIRGWMLGMNRDYLSDAGSNNYFGFELGYDKLTNKTSRNFLPGVNNGEFNGNINGMIWKSKGDQVRRKYDFEYDAANRLLKGDFEQNDNGSTWGITTVDYSMKMGDGADANSAYDYNGNIKRMQQWGLKITGIAQIDDMGYSYQPGSNKLAKVIESATGGTPVTGGGPTGLGDFKDGTNSNDDYSYDVNGNLTLDNNKAISSITYNHLNLPTVITVTGKGTITYTYDAAGNKIEKTTTDITVTPNKITITLYMGGAVYENNVLQFLGQEEGRIRFKPAAGSIAASLQYDYMLKDHLGNVRMVLTEEQQQDKYPVASLEDAKLATEDDYYTIQTANIVAA